MKHSLVKVRIIRDRNVGKFAPLRVGMEVLVSHYEAEQLVRTGYAVVVRRTKAVEPDEAKEVQGEAAPVDEGGSPPPDEKKSFLNGLRKRGRPRKDAISETS